MPNEPNKRGSVGVVLLIAVLVPVLYVLGIGPMSWLSEYGYVSKRTIMFLYTPLAMVMDQSDSIGDVMYWYLGLWVEIDMGH